MILGCLQEQCHPGLILLNHHLGILASNSDTLFSIAIIHSEGMVARFGERCI